MIRLTRTTAPSATHMATRTATLIVLAALVVSSALVISTPQAARADTEKLIDYRVDYMTAELGLSAKQNEQYRALLTDGYQQLMDNLAQTDDQPDKAVTKSREIIAGFNEQLDELLNDKQRKTFTQMKASSMEWLMQTTPDQLADRLKLTESQQTQLVAIFDANGGAVNSLQQELTSQAQTVNEKRRTLRMLMGHMESIDNEVVPILQEQQREEYDSYTHERMQAILLEIEGGAGKKLDYSGEGGDEGGGEHNDD